jgi:hypothetical protein
MPARKSLDEGWKKLGNRFRASPLQEYFRNDLPVA